MLTNDHLSCELNTGYQQKTHQYITLC